MSTQPICGAVRRIFTFRAPDGTFRVMMSLVGKSSSDVYTLRVGLDDEAHHLFTSDHPVPFDFTEAHGTCFYSNGRDYRTYGGGDMDREWGAR